MNMLRRHLSFSIAVLLLNWVSCAAAADVPAGCSTTVTPASMNSFQPNLAVFKAQLLVYRCTSYDNDIELVIQEARAWIKQRAPEVDNPAIVLDIDETSLSNWRRMYYKDGYPYIPHDACDFTNMIEACGDVDWQWSAEAPAVQAVLDLYKLAKCIDVRVPCIKFVDVFFVTGRRMGDKYCPKQICSSGDTSLAKTPTEWTLENLQNAGFVGMTPDHLYMRPTNSDGQVSAYKTGQRIEIEKRGKTVIANIGDQESDFVGGHADRTFKLPNPFYLIP